ncbi:hypothetical protein R515_08900 [Salmonella enterica subsp. arizonae serovar 41:z4,z23:-]|nr:hypothetical protein R515_08900 [Salmonella enterica subsp. arizonae serovar 41:z4,z23:-]
MNIDKQALRISELEELNELLREKVKKLESDLWDKEQLRQVYSEKSFDLECKVRELEARNQKDFVWRGKEISRLNDEVDELKEKLGAAEMQIVNLKQNCENDPRIHEIVDLKESVAELATENVGMKELIEQHANSVAVCPNCSHEEPSETDDIVALYRSMETTATDAFLAEVRAHGVEMFSEKFGGGTLISDMVKEIAKDFAAQLRKGGAA